MITKTSAEWPATKEWLIDQIEKRRLTLEKVGNTPDRYSAMRGEIAAFRAIIETVEPKETRGGAGTNYNK